MRTERKIQFVPESTHCKLELIILSSFFTGPSAVHPPHLLSAAPRLHFNITLRYQDSDQLAAANTGVSRGKKYAAQNIGHLAL